LLCRNLHDRDLEVRRSSNQAFLTVVSQGELVAIWESLRNGDLDGFEFVDQLRAFAVLASLRDGLSGSFADGAVGFSWEFLPIEILLFSQRKSFASALTAGLQIFGAFGSSSLTDGACGLFGELTLDGGAVEDVDDGDRNGEFEGGRLSLIFGLLGVHLVDTGEILDGLEDILAISFVFHPFLFVAQRLECCLTSTLPSLSSFSFLLFSSSLPSPSIFSNFC
jgi:hypothetical protein